MTLNGDRVTCDVPGCEAACERLAWETGHDDGWVWILRPIAPNGIPCDICPACRARYTDDQLRDMIARKET